MWILEAGRTGNITVENHFNTLKVFVYHRSVFTQDSSFDLNVLKTQNRVNK